MNETGTFVESSSGAKTEINTDQYITLYDSDGTESLWKKEDLPKAERLGLSLTKHDIDKAFSEWNANHDARVNVIRGAVKEFQDKGYIVDELYNILNSATGQEIEAYQNLMRAIGARLPHESHLAALAEHKRLYGDLDPKLLPYDAKYNELVDTLPEDRVEYWKSVTNENNRIAGENIRHGLEQGLIKPPDAAMYNGDEGLAEAHKLQIMKQAGITERPEGW